MSEGFDAKDDQCRGLIVIGVPYPNIGDPKYMFKTWIDRQTKYTENLI